MTAGENHPKRLFEKGAKIIVERFNKKVTLVKRRRDESGTVADGFMDKYIFEHHPIKTKIELFAWSMAEEGVQIEVDFSSPDVKNFLRMMINGLNPPTCPPDVPPPERTRDAVFTFEPMEPLKVEFAFSYFGPYTENSATGSNVTQANGASNGAASNGSVM